MSADATALYVGLISGTSMDGVDAALVRLGDHSCTVEATRNQAYDPELRGSLFDASRDPASCGLDDLGLLDQWVGETFRDATLALLADSSVPGEEIAAIGSHGQTLRHQPQARRPYTLQIGDPNVIASGTGITTVADFRRGDIALGGEGAPLAPAFHHWLWGGGATGRAVLNIGGFANLTVLPTDGADVAGFDTGPGNSLMDGWCERHRRQPFDEGGAWAATGTINARLLSQMLLDDYFRRRPPKSTGFEHFNAGWLDAHLAVAGAASTANVQATLCELTARSIADAVDTYALDTKELMVCGGGAHNRHLLARLAAKLPNVTVQSTAAFGVGPDWVEAATFAWLASRCLQGEPGNLPSVTGARNAAVLGCIYPGRS